MNFATLEFIFFFLPLVTFFYFWFRKLRLYILIFSSQIFYFVEGFDALVFLNLAILISFILRKNLFISLILLFLILFVFKYSNHISNFFNIDYLNLLFLNIDLKNTTIFAGLSFYTFQLAGYLIDKKENFNLKKILLFTSFFPQIIAGPIIKGKLFEKNYDEMDLNNLRKKDNYREVFFDKLLPNFLIFFSYGLFYKVICADILSIYSENYSSLIQDSYEKKININFFNFFFYILTYGFRIYFDFAGYSLMAIGIGCLFNFELPKNFDEPYKKSSIKEFWRHWHITLSHWFREYVFYFIKKKYNFVIAIFLTFFLSGVWHGAGSGFIYWGVYHGIIYIIFDYCKNGFLKLNLFLRIVLVNFFIMLSWPFFDIGFILYKYSILNFEFNFNSFYFPINKYFSICFMLFIFFIVYIFDEKKILYKENILNKSNLLSNYMRSPLITSLLFTLSLLCIKISKTFIYFRF